MKNDYVVYGGPFTDISSVRTRFSLQKKKKDITEPTKPADNATASILIAS